jgi:hypothetical protein
MNYYSMEFKKWMRQKRIRRYLDFKCDIVAHCSKVVKLKRVTILIKFNKLVRRARNIIRLIHDLIPLQFA